MASTGYLVKPPEPTEGDRQRLVDKIAQIRAERDARMERFGPIDVSALMREVRDELGRNAPGR